MDCCAFSAFSIASIFWKLTTLRPILRGASSRTVSVVSERALRGVTYPASLPISGIVSRESLALFTAADVRP
jgi:hypothetical protein